MKHELRFAGKHDEVAICPLPGCGLLDSATHMLGECRHRDLKSRCIARHDDAVMEIAAGFQKGAHGGPQVLTMDAGKQKEQEEYVSHPKRIPSDMLPDVPLDVLDKLRPDILWTNEQSGTGTPSDTPVKEVFLAEIKFCCDTRSPDALARADNQHAQVRQLLTDAGWKVTQYSFTFGHAGTTYKHNLDNLIQMGIEQREAEKILIRIHEKSIVALDGMVRQRRYLEHQCGAGHRVS